MNFKKFVAVCMAACLISSVFCTVHAEESLPEAWEPPTNLVLIDKSNTSLEYLYNFTLMVNYDKDQELIDFLDDGKRKNKYGEEVGSITPRVQIDWSIDDTESWIYPEFKEEWDHLSSTNAPVWDYSGSDAEAKSLEPVQTESTDILDLYTNGKREWLETGLQDRVAPYTYTLSNAFNVPVSLIDLSQHTVYVRARYVVKINNSNQFIYSDWSDVAAIGKEAGNAPNSNGDAEPDEPVYQSDLSWTGVSDWALNQVETSLRNGLYPEVLDMEDLTTLITRREFASIAVSLLERFGVNTELPEENPFQDTRDKNVLKAYNAGIILGKSPQWFYPMDFITREEVAVILERIYQKAYDNGTIKRLDGETVNAFRDDAEISIWAKDAVYFMVSNQIMEGVGDNLFAPGASASGNTEAGYTTREQALALAVRLFKHKV